MKLGPTPLSDSRVFRNPENRQLAEIQELDGRFGISPVSIATLDKIGLNHLEIITLSQIVGVQLLKLTPSDCDFLNGLEEDHRVEFVTEYKENVRSGKWKMTTYLNKKLDHVCYGPTADGCWLGVASLIKFENGRKV